MRRLLFVVQLPSGGSTINAAEVQQVAADGLPSQWHRQRRVAHGHSRLPHRAAQRIGQAQGVAGAGGLGQRERGLVGGGVGVQRGQSGRLGSPSGQ